MHFHWSQEIPGWQSKSEMEQAYKKHREAAECTDFVYKNQDVLRILYNNYLNDMHEHIFTNETDGFMRFCKHMYENKILFDIVKKNQICV